MLELIPLALLVATLAIAAYEFTRPYDPRPRRRKRRRA